MTQNGEKEDTRSLRQLDASIERSFDDLRAGRTAEAEAVFDRLAAKYTNIAAERGILAPPRAGSPG